MSVKSVSKMSVKYPKIKSDNKQRFYVVFYNNGKRYRLFNGSKINSNLYPNSYPVGKQTSALTCIYLNSLLLI